MNTIKDVTEMYAEVERVMARYGATEEFRKEFQSRKKALEDMIRDESGIVFKCGVPEGDRSLGPQAEVILQQLHAFAFEPY